MVKVDIQIAYDLVEWSFLEQILHALHFPTKFINWVLAYVKTVSYSILLNKCPLEPFEAKRELRQGDPLSPYLFVLVIEYFSRLVKFLNHN